MAYIPESGDVIWISFDPQAGHEQSGRRPALVISPASYNLKVGLVILCPITTQVKGYPFEVVIPENPVVNGVILSDQVKSLDWKIRKAVFISKLPPATFNEVVPKLGTLIRLQL